MLLKRTNTSIGLARDPTNIRKAALALVIALLGLSSLAFALFSDSSRGQAPTFEPSMGQVAARLFMGYSQARGNR